MSYRADFRAKTSAPLEKELGSPALDRDYGKKWPGLFATYSRDSSTWKTVQCSLFGDSEPYSETWPRSGMTRNGYAYLRPIVAPTIFETASGLWPTPVASEAKAGARTPDGKRGARLTDIIKRPELWPTPCATEARQGLQIRRNGKQGRQQSLTTAVRMQLPTPKARDYRTGDKPENRRTREKMTGKKHSPDLNDVAAPGGQLNPTWVEWLMGWPIGWTELEPLAMAKYQLWPHTHGEFYTNDDY